MSNELSGEHQCWRCDEWCSDTHHYCGACGAHQAGWQQDERMRVFEDRLSTKIAAKMPIPQPSPWPNPSAAQNLKALVGGIVFAYAVILFLASLH